jgi:hypothetical protein
MMKENISRRNFLKGASATALGVAASGLISACEPKVATTAPTNVEATEAPAAPVSSWRTPPEPIADDQISTTYDCDVLSLGVGFAGLCALRAAAEKNPDIKLMGVERQKRDEWALFGHDFGHINSEFQADLGIPKVDEVEFLNNWQLMTQNKSNPALVMQFAKHSGETIDWIRKVLSQSVLDACVPMFWPETEHVIHQLNTGFRYYPGTAQWWTADNAIEAKEVMKDVLAYVEASLPSVQLFFGTTAQYVLKDASGAVVGAIATDADGKYVKYNAKRVILATGDFGSNPEMVKDLLGYIMGMTMEGDNVAMPMARDGTGHKMGVWAGGRLETEISTMGLDTIMADTLGGLWLDEEAIRFCNESYSGPEIRTFIAARLKRRKIVAVYDSTAPEMALYSFPGHGSFEPTQENIDALVDQLDKAYKAGATGDNGYFAADSLDQLAEYVGYTGEQKAAFLAQVEQYNTLCDAGVDSDFGKDPRLMFPIKAGPFYGHVITPTIGFGLVTTGGFVTDNDQQVLGQDYKPIPGLYASGNTCGMRFGPAYITPTPGVSIGIACTLGKVLGEHLVDTVA